MKKNCFCLAILSFLAFGILLSLPIGTTHAQGETATIQIVGPAQSPGFLPPILTVHVFDYVIFSNQALPAASYSIAADDGTFSSPAIASGKQWAVTFTTPGTYEYHDTANPPHMVGVIIAVASSVTLLPVPSSDVEATAIALVQAGKTPPDNLALVTPTPTTSATPHRSTTLPLAANSYSWLIIPLLITESSLLLLIFLGGFLLVRSYRQRLRQLQSQVQHQNETGLPLRLPEKVGIRQRVLHRFKRHSEEEDEEEEDFDEDV